MTIDSQQAINVPFLVKERPYLRTVLDGIRAYLEANSELKIVMPQYYTGNDYQIDYTAAIVGQITGVPRLQHLDAILARRIPTVLIGFSPRPESASSVVWDYERIAQLAMDHFVQQGVSTLAYVGSDDPLKRDHIELCHSVTQCASKLSVELVQFENAPLGSGPGLRDQIGRIAEWLKDLPPQTGIICGDDDYANRVLMGSYKAGLKAGQDFLLLGCGNDTVFCQSANPKLSSIELDYFGMGWTAAKKLYALISSESEENEELVVRSSILQARRSSRRSGLQGGIVDRAMELIWNRFESVSSVDVLAARLGVTRRTLDRHFRQQLRTSAAVEIRRARMEKAKQMLVNERVELSDIAQECGFYDQAHLSREFKREIGCTPLSYRRRHRQKGVA